VSTKKNVLLCIALLILLGLGILPAQDPPLLEHQTIALAIDRTESVVPQVGQVLRHPKGWLVLEYWISMKARALLFSPEGHFVQQIGGFGQGPGEYVCAKYAWLDERNHLFLTNHNPPHILEYDQEFKPVQIFPNAKVPERMFLVGPLAVMLNISPAPGQGRIVWKNRAYRDIRTGGTVEELATRIGYVEVGDLALVRDQLWLADTYDPWIQVYDLSGKHLRTLGQHLEKAPFCMHSRQIGKVPLQDTKAFDKKSAGMQFTTHVLNLDNQVVLVGPYRHGEGKYDPESSDNVRHWDVYAPDGTLLLPQMRCPIKTKGYRFIQNANTEEFYQVDDWSDDLEEKNLSARIHIYRLAPRWREALARLKAGAKS